MYDLGLHRKSAHTLVNCTSRLGERYRVLNDVVNILEIYHLGQDKEHVPRLVYDGYPLDV